MDFDLVREDAMTVPVTNESVFEKFRKQVLLSFIVAAANESPEDALQYLQQAEALIALSGMAPTQIDKRLTRENMTMIRQKIEEGQRFSLSPR